MDGNRTDTRTLNVGETGIHGKQSTGVVDCDKVHSSAYMGEDRSRALPSRTFWLKEWEEARGILQHIDLNEGSITFEGFIVRIPPSLSADVTSLNTLIGLDVSILRTDSPNHIIIPARAQVTIKAVKLNQTTPNTFVDAQERTETNKSRTEPRARSYRNECVERWGLVRMRETV